MDISYDYYRIFYYVAKYKSFTGAAEALLNSQPNITRTMKKLEKELGCTLFVRQRHGIALTPEGEKLYAHISAAFAVVTDPFAPNIIKSVYYKYFIIVGTRMFISTGFAT